jgi:hypothetical protein
MAGQNHWNGSGLDYATAFRVADGVLGTLTQGSDGPSPTGTAPPTVATAGLICETPLG